jgi:transcriptional regulator with XRE-family HTH domain
MKHEEDILIEFGNRLRSLRKAAGYSQEGFALECNLDRSYVGAIERGERNLSLRNLNKFANVLGLTLSGLFDGL